MRDFFRRIFSICKLLLEHSADAVFNQGGSEPLHENRPQNVSVLGVPCILVDLEHSLSCPDGQGHSSASHSQFFETGFGYVVRFLRVSNKSADNIVG